MERVKGANIGRLLVVFEAFSVRKGLGSKTKGGGEL
jgi:hypothetical protein